jgi:hypothetical protein
MSKLKYKTVGRYGYEQPDPSLDTTEHPDALVRRVLKGEVSSEGRGRMKYQVLQHDTYISQTGWLRMEIHDDNIYRIGIFPDGVDVMCFGLANVDSHIDGHYDLSDDLPNWVKERLAVLMITSGTPPTQEVVGVGRRISNHVYWVYAPDTVS